MFDNSKKVAATTTTVEKETKSKDEPEKTEEKSGLFQNISTNFFKQNLENETTTEN